MQCFEHISDAADAHPEHSAVMELVQAGLNSFGRGKKTLPIFLLLPVSAKMCILSPGKV